MATVSGITLPKAASNAAPAGSSALTGSFTPSTTQLSLGTGYTSSINPNFNPGFSALSSGGIVPSGIPVPAGLKQTATPTSAITKQPVSGYASSGVNSGSLVDYLNSTGKASDYGSRASLAAQYGIQGYSGTADQNTQLLNMLRSGSVASSPTQTATGATVMADQNSNVTSPSSFTIDTSGTVPADALGSNFTSSDVANQQQSYSDYVNGLAQANQYSPDYLNAYQQVQNIQTAEAALRGNLATGDVRGDTEGYAEGATNRQLMGLGAQEAFANVGLQVQQLARQGNIAAATALVQGAQPQQVSAGSSLVNPMTGGQVYSGIGGYTDVQAIQAFNNIAQEYGDAPGGITYDTTQTPQQNLARAQQLMTQSPKYNSQQTVQVTLPGGGITFVNKNQLVPGSDGQTLVISPADAATADAAKSTISSLTEQMANVQGAVTTADQNFPLLLTAAQQAGVNDSAPLVNEIQQKIANKTSQSAALAALNTLLPSLQTEYARILSRGGAVTDSERANSQALINGTYSLAQLQSVYDTVKQESANVIAGYQSQIDQQNQNLQSIYGRGQAVYGDSTAGTSSAGTGGYITPSQAASVSW